MEQSRLWRFSFGSLLMLAMTVGSLPAFAIGTLAPFLVREFDISRASVGFLITFLFLIGSLGSPVSGSFVDRIGGRRMLIAIFLLSAAAMLGMSAAPAYGFLLIAVGISGIATTTLNPTTNKLISSHLPLGRQGVITGFKQSGVQAASFLAGLALPTLALAIGWRGSLVASATLAAVGIAATWALVPRPEPDATAVASGPRPSDRLGPTVAWLTAYALTMGTGMAAVVSFLVIYSVEALGMAESVAGLTAATMGLFGIVSRVLWARQVERLPSSWAPLAFFGACGVASVGAIWGAAPGPVWLVWIGSVLVGSTVTAWNAVGNLVLIRELPSQVAGKAAGMMNLGFYGGFVISPVAFGWLVDVTGSYSTGWALACAVFVLAAGIATAWGLRGDRGRRRWVVRGPDIVSSS